MQRDFQKEAAHSLTTWGKAYGKFAPILKRHKCKIGAEIGVAYGGHSEYMLQHTNLEKLYAIDPYRYFPEYDDPMNLPQKKFDQLYSFTSKRLKRFGDRVKMVRKTSEEASAQIKKPLDFVYLDANHSFEGVKDDLRLWYEKVKEDGIIAGHDYDHVNFPGVKKAVHEFFDRFGWEIHHEGEGVWWVQKKALGISYIIPAFNAAKFITDAVESIYNGNFEPGDEIVIVNDASMDNTADVVKQLAKKHPEIKVLHQETNKGGGASRNTAVKNSSNPLIFCLDADNVLVPNSVTSLKQELLVSGVSNVSFAELRYFKSNVENIDHTWLFEKDEYTFADYLVTYKVPGASGNYLYTRAAWEKCGGYPEKAKALDAWGFGLKLAATGYTTKVASNTWYYHRLHNESYWVRESKLTNMSTLAYPLLKPYLHRLSLSDRMWILLHKHSWFDSIEKHPLKVK